MISKVKAEENNGQSLFKYPLSGYNTNKEIKKDSESLINNKTVSKLNKINREIREIASNENFSLSFSSSQLHLRNSLQIVHPKLSLNQKDFRKSILNILIRFHSSIDLTFDRVASSNSGIFNSFLKMDQTLPLISQTNGSINKFFYIYIVFANNNRSNTEYASTHISDKPKSLLINNSISNIFKFYIINFKMRRNKNMILLD